MRRTYLLHVDIPSNPEVPLTNEEIALLQREMNRVMEDMDFTIKKVDPVTIAFHEPISDPHRHTIVTYKERTER